MTNNNIALTYKLGGETEINRLGYGGMQLTGPGVWGDAPNRALAVRLLHSAVESGTDLFDTADAYGPNTNEVLYHDALHAYYDKIVVATKGGLQRSGPNQWHVNGDPEYIASTIEALLIPGTRSLAHLQENMAAVQVKLTDEEFSLLSRSF